MVYDPKQVIKNVARQAPVVNQEAVRQQQAAQQVLQQQQMAQMPQVGNITRQVQQAAPQAMLQQAAPALQAQQQTTADIQRLGGQALQQERFEASRRRQMAGMQQQEMLARQQMQQERTLSGEVVSHKKRLMQDEVDSARMLQQVGIEQDNRLLSLSIQQRKQLADLGRDVKGKIMDARIRFDRDELGRKFSNERQMWDWTIANAKSEQDFNMKVQQMKQIQERHIAMMERAHQLLIQSIERGYLEKEQKLNFEQKGRLINLANEMQKKIERDKARAANNMMMAQAGGTLLAMGAVALAPITGGASFAAYATAGAAGGAGGGLLYGSGAFG
jgi:hypothetical protein